MSAARQPRRARAAGRGQAGMTLIEVLMALTILSFMLIITWSTTSTTVEAKQHFEIMQERNHEIRVAMGRMARDISSAYISGNENESLTNRRTLFIGDSNSPVDELRFSSLGHVVLWADANESEQTLISYQSEPDPENPRQTNLLRRESRRLSNEQWESEPAEVDLLLRNIERVELEYFDWRDNEWQTSWDSTGADAEQGRLPSRVRITVTMREGDREIKRSTQARIMMQEKLILLPN